jgi:outer membrane protein TolC
LFDGGERYAERDERVALARATALEARAQDRQVPLQLATARVNLANAQSALQQAEVALNAAQQNSRELQVLYRQGLARAIDLADANVSLFEAQVALVRERLSLGLAFLDLRAALGLDPLGREL